MRKIMISIALVALMLTGCSKNEGKITAVENIATDTVATIGDASVDVTTEEVAEEPAPEKETLEAEATTEAPATTEIGGGKKKAEETTEEQKPSTSSNGGSSHSNTSSNGGSANSGQSTTPKPSNSGSSSGSSGSSNNSGNNNSNNGGSSNSGNNTPKHQHNYNVKVVDTAAWDEKVIDQAAYDKTIEHPEEGYWAPAVQCHGCGQVFTSMEALDTHADHGSESYGSADDVWVKTKDAWTETKHYEEKSHVVHHDEVYHYECECGARK